MYKLAYVSVQATYTHWPAGHPLPGAVLKTLCRTSYTLRSLYIALKYAAALCYNIASCMRARAHAAWHGVSICSTPLRARLSEGVERRSRRRGARRCCC